ncbi:MAG TPA: alpha/beta fold hydrolase [Xanthomonadales bacterium]|nr:alpha/beta fold hydrolase [Xanthomonadales bacterium]
MHLHKHIKGWVTDYYHMIRGGVAMTIHTSPPSHYLGYVVPEKAPIIIIPGILLRWGFMKHLGDKISHVGHPVYIVPQLKYNLHSIPTSAKIVRAVTVHAIPKLGQIIPDVAGGAKTIRDVIEKHNLQNAVIVAHSKGGLIGKYLLAHFNKDHRVKGMVAIATPFTGSALAKLIPRNAFDELQEDSKIIHDLEGHTTVNHQIISIFPEYDNHIWAKNASYVEGALKNIQVNVYGHHKVLFSKQVEKKVLESIEEIS